MKISLGNAPCSWGVEFADDPRNPPWRQVLKDCADAGYRGIELGPIGYMPEDPVVLADALAEHDLSLIGGVVFRPFHDPYKWDEVRDAAIRTARSLSAHGARHFVLIDSISARRAPTAGRADEAEQMEADEWRGLKNRIEAAAQIGADHGLIPSIHAHAGGFIDFEPELDRLLDAIDADLLKICFDTGHHSYAGFDPVDFLERHAARVSYMHFKDIDPAVKARVVATRTDFYTACGQGIFCNLGKGDVDFPAVRRILVEAGFDGWCTVEQDCDPMLAVSPIEDARANRAYLRSIGF
ncbi:myo-inositol catabolism protein [Salipiger sp. IMCC34102]|uniref:TIM barrel protein n=1 Tax=Salipiger sp. IMCC34102 TaxID=2510647 RepID=UPI00101CAC70|nr:TIM barrel protein [Salipiger sp. IMCC34102]RYH02116.1 myo-inositol catabolism protein [Salipiger sp. IMCC34102]